MAHEGSTSGLTAVRRFARATNLLVAGRRFAIVGEGAEADAIRGILTGLGARAARDGERVDQLWVTGGADAERSVRETAARQPGSPLVVIDAGAAAPAIDTSVFGRCEPARPGVVALVELPGVFVVTLDAAVTGAPVASDQDPAALVVDANRRIEWARRFMPISAAMADFGRGPGLFGLRIAVSMVLEPKTAVLALLLRDAGAVVDVYAHADETDDAVAAALRQQGVDVFASSTATPSESRALALELLDRRPDIVLDDGSHVIRLAHELRPELLPTMIGAAEETTSGLRPLRIMADRGELRMPVIAVNDARTKTFFDNRYGTGQSCVFAILDLLDSAPKRIRKRGAAGRTAVVAGFGHVGEGVARTLSAVGLRVVVSEIDPVRALQAVFAGYEVAPLVDAVAGADLVVSATGVRDTVSLAVLRACAPGAVVAVAGGVDQEIALDAAAEVGAHRESLLPKIDRLAFDADADAGTDADTDVIVLDDGGCINITAGEGNPVEIMDLSFAVQIEAVRALLDQHGRLDVGVHALGSDVDHRIAEAALDQLGLASDFVPAWSRVATPAAGAGGAGAHAGTTDTRTTRFGPRPADGEATE